MSRFYPAFVVWLYLEKSPWLREKLEKVSGIDTTTYAWSEALGKAMFDLNIAGVNSRYGDGEAKQFRELNYHYVPAHGSEIQVLKSLQCWLYQCTEGEVVKHPLYVFFDTIVERHLMDEQDYLGFVRIPGGCLGVTEASVGSLTPFCIALW